MPFADTVSLGRGRRATKFAGGPVVTDLLAANLPVYLFTTTTPPPLIGCHLLRRLPVQPSFYPVAPARVTDHCRDAWRFTDVLPEPPVPTTWTRRMAGICDLIRSNSLTGPDGPITDVAQRVRPTVPIFSRPQRMLDHLSFPALDRRRVPH